MPKLQFSTIRARLLVSFVVVTLLPAIGISVGSAIVGYRSGRQQAIGRLESAAALKELAISGWVQSLQQELVIASQSEGEFERISVVLDLAQENKYYDFYNKAVQRRLQSFVRQSALLQEIALVDPQGRVVLTTDGSQDDGISAGPIAAAQPSALPTVVLPFRSDQSQTDASTTAGVTAIVAIPITSHDGRVLGSMVGRAGMAPFDEALQERTGLGGSGKAYVVNTHHELLTGPGLQSGTAAGESQAPQFVSTAGIATALGRRANGSGVYRDYRGISVIGVYRWMPDLQVVLAVEQDLTEAFGAVYALIGVNLSIALAAMLLAALASLFITRSIARPLEDLVSTARQIAAGDLGRVAKVEHDDEVKALAQAFNTMTAQLRDLINGLEQRVSERTRDLEEANQAIQRRAVQLETSVRVSREITSILNIDALMAQVVKLIRDTFGYYRVHIFLLDPAADQLVLRATSGGLKPHFQRIPVGERSINSRAVQTGAAQLVNDVTHDPYYLLDERLPDTRSELIIPLRLGDQVIGTLDVHSAEVNAFTSEDVLVIQSLGDQIAIAIENARLYDRSRELAILEERTRLARDLHDSVTQSLYSVVLLTEGWRRLAAGGNANLEEYLGRIGAITQQALKEMRLLIHELRPPALESEGLLGALHQRIDAVEKRAGVEARLIVDDLIELPAPAEESLYRIAQEALNNALKHSDATAVTIRICTQGDDVILEVSDNGRGFVPEAAERGGGLGLIGMKERARQLGGMLTVVSMPGQGTTVRAIIPASDCASVIY